MTRDQMKNAINTLIGLAEIEVKNCKEFNTEYTQSSWIACMTAAKVFSGLADVLIKLRREMKDPHNGQEENLPQL